MVIRRGAARVHSGLTRGLTHAERTDPRHSQYAVLVHRVTRLGVATRNGVNHSGDGSLSHSMLSADLQGGSSE